MLLLVPRRKEEPYNLDLGLRYMHICPYLVCKPEGLSHYCNIVSVLVSYP